MAQRIMKLILLAWKIIQLVSARMKLQMMILTHLKTTCYLKNLFITGTVFGIIVYLFSFLSAFSFIIRYIAFLFICFLPTMSTLLLSGCFILLPTTVSQIANKLLYIPQENYSSLELIKILLVLPKINNSIMLRIRFCTSGKDIFHLGNKFLCSCELVHTGCLQTNTVLSSASHFTRDCSTVIQEMPKNISQTLWEHATQLFGLLTAKELLSCHKDSPLLY